MIYGLTKEQYDECIRSGISPGTMADNLGADMCEDRRRLHNDEAALRTAQRNEFASMLAERDAEYGLQIWWDGEATLSLGYERPRGRGFVILASVFTDGRIVATPPRMTTVDIIGTHRDGDRVLKPWMQQRVAERLRSYKLIVPRGVL